MHIEYLSTFEIPSHVKVVLCYNLVPKMMTAGINFEIDEL